MSSRGLLGRQVSPSITWLLLTLLALSAGERLQSRVLLNHDVSWIAHSAKWLLDGGVFGVDVLDPSPPMAWILAMPAAAIVKAGITAEPVAVRATYWAYFLLAAGLLFYVLSRFSGQNRLVRSGWKLAFMVAATLSPGASFGQREFVSVIFAMPYLSAASLRLQGGEGLNRLGAMAVGLLGGIAFSIKPFFLAVPLLVESLILMRAGPLAVRRTEVIIASVVVAAYIIGILWLLPDYLTQTVPLIQATYWAYQLPDHSILLQRLFEVAQPAVFAGLIALISRTWTMHHSVLLLASIGYSVSYYVQGKGFVYHAYPVFVCGLVLLGICLAAAIDAVRVRMLSASVLLRVPAITLLVMFAAIPLKGHHDEIVRWYSQFNTAWGPVGKLRSDVISMVNQLAPSESQYFYAFSTHPFPGFPTASYTAAEWSGRSATQFVLPAFAHLDSVEDLKDRKRILQAAELQRRLVTEDLTNRPPEVVFWYHSPRRLGMYGRQFDDLAFYLADPQFSHLWAAYREREPLGPLRVFIRDGEGRGK